MPLGGYLGRRDAGTRLALARREVGGVEASAPVRRRHPRRPRRAGASGYTGRSSASTTLGAKSGIASIRSGRDAPARPLARANNAVDREKAIKRQLRNIERRALHRAWLERTRGSKGARWSSRRTRKSACGRVLRDELGLDIEAADRVTAAGAVAESRSIGRVGPDISRLKGRLDHEAVRRRIVNLLRDERRYWARRAGA